MDSMQASKDKKLDNNNNNKFILYKSIRILFYCTLLLFILLINISAGLFTSSSIEIKNNLQIEDFKFGLFFLFPGARTTERVS